MGSFQQGFALGAQMYDDTEKIRLMKDAAAREKEKFDWEREQKQRERDYTRAYAEESALKQYSGGEDANVALKSDLGGMNDAERTALLERLSQLRPEQQKAAYDAYVQSNLGAVGQGQQPRAAIGTIYRDQKTGSTMVTSPGMETIAEDFNVDLPDRVAAEGALGRARTDEEVASALESRMRREGNLYGIKEGMALKKGGLDIRAAEQGIQKGALEIKAAERAEEAAIAEKEFSQWLQGQMKELQEDPLAWAQKNINLYNKPGKGSRLDDGMTAEIVKGVDANGQPVYNFVQRDKKGNGVFAAPVNQQTAMQALQELAFDKYAALPGKFKDGETMRNQRTVAESGRITAEAARKNADTEEKYKTQIYPQEKQRDRELQEKIASLQREILKGKSTKQQVEDLAEAIVDAKEINPDTKKPYTAEEAKRYALGVAMREPRIKESNAATQAKLRDFRKALTELGPKATTQEKRQLAIDMGLDPEEVGINDPILEAAPKTGGKFFK